jgi:hypothetical protein
MAKWFVLVLTGILGLGAALNARPSTQVPREMIGGWAGGPAVVGDWTELTRIDVSLFIAPDGRVDGMIGGATLKNARIERTRHLFGRIFKYGRDWRVAGDLDGYVVPCEGPPKARVIISLDWERDHFEGGFVAAQPQIRGHREIFVSSGGLRLDRIR